MRSSGVRRSFLVTALVIAASLVTFTPGLREWTLSALDWMEQIGPWGPAAFVVVYIVATIGLIPGALLTLGAGAAFGLWRGVLAVVIGSNLGATAAFLLGRTVLRGWADGMVARRPRYVALDQAVAKNGFRLVVLTRLSPLLPFNFLNYAFGLTRLSLRDYVVASTVGMLPGTFLFVYLGATAKSLRVLERSNAGGIANQLLFGSGLIATLVLTHYLVQLAQAALAQEAHLYANAPIDEHDTTN